MNDENRQWREIHAGFSIIYRHGRVLHDKAMKQFHLTGQQMGYLRYIHEHPGIAQEELVKLLRIDKGAVAKSIKDMVEKGYIERRQNPQDKRAYCLFPTAKADCVAKNGQKHAQDFEQKLTEGMTPQEIEAFKLLLGKITDNMAKLLEEGKV